MKKRYNPREIEPKWQAYWLENQTFKAEEANSKPKYYVLDMFPYPSGAGLHVGHVEGYTATDIIARYKRQRGFNVLHPMGWDSFGLPAEQYAIRTGTHPEETTKKNIDNFRRQLQSLGFSYDWSREVATSDPDYYKWTQWIFTKLYERGLAYQAEMQVNFCPALGTVLANEEIENGKSIEGGYPVEKRPLKQWVLKITAYADRLIEDLDLVNWPESLKRLQRNWIGKSEGVEVLFRVDKSEQVFKVYTTRPDTLFGATFAVLAPEHPLVPEITSKLQRPVVEEYLLQAARKSDLERADLSRTKTGVFTGAYAINPANGEKVPIWVADYILIGYGTGAVMAVPCHDERDFEFAEEYGLPVTAVIDPDFTTGPDWSAEGLSKEAMRKEILEGRQCWPGEGPCIRSSNEEISLNGLLLEEAKEKMIDWLEAKGLGKRAVNYKLRDWLFSRQRYWGEPFPILHFEDGTKRTLELDELPLSPPEVPDYKPSKDGRSPLARVEEWLRVLDPKTGKRARRESDTMPQWAGSCWYYLRFTDPKNREQAWSREAEQYWMPVDLYIGGVEHAVLHLLYARFWHKVLYDCGLVKDKEPFRTLRNQGIIVARSFQKSSGAYVAPEEVVEREGRYFHREDGSELSTQIEKMSKSKLNGVTPDEIVSEFGADALRLYEMFMGPLEKEKIWNTDAVNGCRRFLSRFHDLFFSGKLSDEESEEALKLGYRLIEGVSSDVEKLQFNTAIAKMMEFLNDFSKLDAYPKRVCSWAVQVLSPFAPHLAEELWEELGMESELSRTPYPEVDPNYLVEETATYVVQVNGKVRGRFELPKDQTEEAILQLAKKQPNISKQLEGKAVRKVVFVPNKLLNIVAS